MEEDHSGNYRAYSEKFLKSLKENKIEDENEEQRYHSTRLIINIITGGLIITIMSSSNYDPAATPLFGDPQPRDRMLNLVVGVFTSIAVLVTLISAFVFPKLPPDGVNVFFAVVIVMICCSHLFLIYWYRQGDLDPKFRKMIIYNAFTIILLCVCGNLYIHGLANKK